MFSHFVLFVFCIVAIGTQSPLLTRMYLMGHFFLATNYKSVMKCYSTKQQLIYTSNRAENRARNARMRKVCQLLMMNENSGKTKFDLYLHQYIDIYDCWLWDCVYPDDAKDNYKEHEPDFNDWEWGSANGHVRNF